MTKFLIKYIHKMSVKCEAIVEAEDVDRARQAIHSGNVIEECEVSALEYEKIIPVSVSKITDDKFIDEWKLENHNNLVDESEEELLREMVMDLLGQGCGKYNREKDIMEYDHMCLSSYEHGLRLAVRRGWIKESQLLR